jgi:hypothetical protein
MRVNGSGGWRNSTVAVAVALQCCGGQPGAKPRQAAPGAANAPGVTGGPQAGRETASGTGALLAIGSARLRVSFDRGAFAVGDARLLAWIERSAEAVLAYYGSFPVADLEIRLRAVPGRGLRGGRVLPIAEPTIAMDVGTSSVEAQLWRNWSMTHEMVHLAFPNVPRAHHWLEEGLASYVEPIARARIGWLDEAAVWREWIENLPLGLPEAGDRGLDHTPTWGRTYWGGALFCFLADLQIRRVTAGRRELGDALRAIVASGGNITRRWPLERALRRGDEATGTTVLQDLYRDMKDQPKSVDLDAIWRDLGVALREGRVHYDDGAPLAALRRGFVAKRGSRDDRL